MNAIEYAEKVIDQLEIFAPGCKSQIKILGANEMVELGYSPGASAGLITEGVRFPCGCGCGDGMDAADATCYFPIEFYKDHEWYVEPYSGWLLAIYHKVRS